MSTPGPPLFDTRSTLETRLDPVNKTSNFITALTNRENEIKEQREVVKQEIHAAIEEMIVVL